MYIAKDEIKKLKNYEIIIVSPSEHNGLKCSLTKSQPNKAD